MATGSYRREIEARIPVLRQCARALADGRDHADELVHDVLVHALRTERTWAGEDVAVRLLSRLIGANRSRMRSEVAERRSAPGYPMQSGGTGSGRTAYPASGTLEPVQDDLFADLALNEREALVIVVLGGLDHPVAAQVLGVPTGVLVTRVTQARERLGHTPWAARSPGRKPSARTAGHLRLVKS